MFTNDSYDMNSENSRVETLIGHSVKVEGEMTSQGNITIDGEFSGTLKVGGKLTVGKEATLKAEVTAQEAFFAGELEGNINVTDRLELAGSAKIQGDLIAGVLVVEAGAKINGSCKMGHNNVMNQKATSNISDENLKKDTKNK